jgi:mannan endo-1,6-alpha-mannosidase
LQTNGNSTWQTRVSSLLGAASTKFFSNGVLWEPACETNFNCDDDQFCFKGFLAQYMATITQLASFTSATVYPLLATSATAAGNACDLGTNNTQCTMWWTASGATGPATLGVGQQMSALNVFNANLMQFMTTSSIASSTDGGSSTGNPDAGASTTDDDDTTYFPNPSLFRFGD